MKKIFSLILMLLLVIAVPFTLTGCDSNHTASEIASEYTKIQQTYTSLYNTNNQFRVVFSGSNINSGKNNQNSKIYSLGYVYLPLIDSSMAFVNSTFDINNSTEKSRVTYTFKECLDKFNQSQLNNVYAGLSKFKSALSSFNSARNNFDAQNKQDGTGYSTFIGSMSSLIEGALSFNMAFYNAYYESIYVKERDYTKSGFTFSSNDIAVEVLGGRLYIANMLYNRYIKYYVWSSNYSITTFVNRSDNSYLKGTISSLGQTTSGNYTDSKKNTLIALRQSHDTYLLDMNRALSEISNFNYKVYYTTSTAPQQYLESQSQAARDSYESVENFLESRYLPLYNAVNGLAV